MNLCSLRACCLSNPDELFVFTVADIPAIIGENTLALLNRPFSPLLALDTLAIGSDVDVYQDDVIVSNGETWYVMCDKGFVLLNYDKTKRKLLYELDDYEVVRRMNKDELEHFEMGPRRIRFKSSNGVFTIKDIIGKYGTDIVASNIVGSIAVEDVKQDTTYAVNRHRYYFGDIYKGWKLVMCYGRVCVQNEFGVYDIVEEKYITRK